MAAPRSGKTRLPAAEMTLEILGSAASIDEEDVTRGLSVCRRLEALDAQLLVGEPATNRRQQTDLVRCPDPDERLRGFAAVGRDRSAAGRDEARAHFVASRSDRAQVVSELRPRRRVEVWDA